MGRLRDEGATAPTASLRAGLEHRAATAILVAGCLRAAAPTAGPLTPRRPQHRASVVRAYGRSPACVVACGPSGVYSCRQALDAK